MKIYAFALGSLALIATSIAWAEETPAEQCQRFAVEDNIPAEEMEGYIQQCLTDLEQAEKDLPLDLAPVTEDAPAGEPSESKE